jgi:hypothetical protein
MAGYGSTSCKAKKYDPRKLLLLCGFNVELNPAWDLVFRPGIARAGYFAFRIDQKEHANKICDEIIAKIRRSRFVVADYTGHRGGVYIARIARGLEVEAWKLLRDG